MKNEAININFLCFLYTSDSFGASEGKTVNPKDVPRVATLHAVHEAVECAFYLEILEFSVSG